MDILAKREKDPTPVRNLFFEQVEGIGKSSGIEITPEEIYLYGVLRERSAENNLSNIRLVVEVIHLRGNITKRKFFESQYPHVDLNSVM